MIEFSNKLTTYCWSECVVDTVAVILNCRKLYSRFWTWRRCYYFSESPEFT